MILNDATHRQIEAADPKRSTWLSANAGSGKTRVLTDRVARLLLNGTRPENILCLTYTKAAASEMQNRLFQRLGEWAMMPEGKLRKSLIDLGDDQTVDPSDVRKARTLFAAAIETPGGLKIQTIHSFCAGVLRRFPLEAAVSPQFKEMEDRAAQLLREEVLDDIAKSDSNVLAEFAKHYTGADISSFLAAITGRRAAFLAPPSDADLCNRLGLTHGTDPAAALKVAFIGDEADLAKDLLEAAPNASASYVKFAKSLTALPLTAPTLETLETLFEMFLTKGQRRKWPASNHKSAWEAFDHLLDDMFGWMDRTAQAFDYLNKIKALEKTRALYSFARPFVEAYETRKLQRGALDFDDLIGKAKALLEDPIVAQWVLFRLDGGVDHVLVDEAQDTSPDQWDIVRLLTQEFSTGIGANPDRRRTIFVVGDKKQSIYSFQGADPEGFDRMRDHFDAELQKIQSPLQVTELLYSFRSSEAVLRMVDQTFAGDMAEGLGDTIKHLAFKNDMPGRVDLWPLIEPSDKPEERDWDDPLDQKGETNHKVILAGRIANEIGRMIQEETLPVKQGDTWVRRKITPGDFLILVQRRSDIFGEIIAACKSAGLDVAGADRLKLGGELAVKDISALLHFLALPEDDLSLAAALKSPLFGWGEKELYDLAQPRPKGQTLWEALRKSGLHDRTMTILDDLRRQSDFIRPYDLINRILIRHDGRRNLLARLGHEAEDGIDALLSQALGYEQSAVPSLTGFLSWMQTDDVTVKRQMDTAGDRIRVMTVHGAKGLEAPIVILPDTADRKRDLRGDLLSDGSQIYWKPKSEVMPNVLNDVKEDMLAAQDRERRRLLYVALTRAESWLIVAAAGKAEDDKDSWHATLRLAIGHLDCIDAIGPFGPFKRFSRHDWDQGPLVSITNEKTPSLQPIDDWTTLPTLPEPTKIIAPSDLGGDKALAGETATTDTETALAWGRIIHLLLELLPEIDDKNWHSTGHSLISNHPDVGLIHDKDALLNEVVNILNDPTLWDIFNTGIAEVPITANLPALNGARIYGIIDRLIVSDTEILAVDFKSNSTVPDQPELTPVGLVRQMAAYRDALKQIYPDHQIRTALLWTKTRTLSELADSTLDAALADVTIP